ncbi:hypothetical protein BDZ91DRAFT_100593 [Kalaharituber pfeilii]|nr:hypothetical protein BDZ91DRAFT_100593 [Kalaharituber pfeilii]
MPDPTPTSILSPPPRQTCLSAIYPPILTSATPWATTQDELLRLYTSPYTGAITTRTTTLNGFPDDPAIHKVAFFNPISSANSPYAAFDLAPDSADPGTTCSVNTYGYSPHALPYYLTAVRGLAAATESTQPPLLTPGGTPRTQPKPIIISITGTPEEVSLLLTSIGDTMSRALPTPPLLPVWAEINLSCPNIRDKPPPAYSPNELSTYFDAVRSARASCAWWSSSAGKIGIKIPPYTYDLQVRSLVDVLSKYSRGDGQAVVPVLDFVTATNTLGNNLVFTDTNMLGALSGPALHTLSLGTVHLLRKGLDEAGLRSVGIIGVGGVSDGDGWTRMKRAGADVVGVGVAIGVGIGRWGVEEGVEKVLGEVWMGVEKWGSTGK